MNTRCARCVLVGLILGLLFPVAEKAFATERWTIEERAGGYNDDWSGRKTWDLSSDRNRYGTIERHERPRIWDDDPPRYRYEIEIDRPYGPYGGYGGYGGY